MCAWTCSACSPKRRPGRRRGCRGCCPMWCGCRSVGRSTLCSPGSCPPPAADDAGGTWHRYYLRWPMMTLEQLAPGLLELVPELAAFAPPARVLDKRVYSPWFEGRLAGVLGELAVDTLIVSGTETEVCVLATVLGAIDHGYRVIVV